MLKEIPNSFNWEKEKVKYENEKSNVEDLEKLTSTLRLRERDFRILEFVLDQKFATVYDLHHKFFSELKENRRSTSLLYARERLHVLRSNGLLKVQRHAFDFRNFYLATAKAVTLLEKKFPSRVFPRAMTRIDIRTFEHDKVVNAIRLFLESRRVVKEWLSDRLLNTDHSLTNGMPKDFLPDAIYRNQKDEMVALEFENSQKTKSQYGAKVENYKMIIRSTNATDQVVQKVQYVVARDNVFKLLHDSTEIYNGMFEVTRLKDFFEGQRWTF